MNSINKFASIALVSAMVVLTAGCDRKTDTATTDDTTAGQKLDNAVAESKQESTEAGNYVEQKTDSAVQSVDDAAITAAIKAKLIADDELKAIDINVDTAGGVVTMTGVAPTASAMERATTIAKSVDGVTDVKNQLTTTN